MEGPSGVGTPSIVQNTINTSSVHKTHIMNMKLDEWDDPTLSELSHRVLHRRPTLNGVFEEEKSDHDSGYIENDEMLGGELIIKVHGAKVSPFLSISAAQAVPCITEPGYGSKEEDKAQGTGLRDHSPDSLLIQETVEPPAGRERSLLHSQMRRQGRANDSCAKQLQASTAFDEV